MSLKAPTIVIFDMDGTTVRHLNPRLLHILERLDDASYTLSKFFRWLARADHKKPIIKSDDKFINRKKPRLLVHRAIHKIRRKTVDQIVEPYPGIYDTLDLLKKNKTPIALVSNGLGKGYGHDILQTFDLHEYYNAVVFREDIHRSKPNPEPLLTALKKMGITPTEKDTIWYIGDRRKDVLAAINLAEHTKATIIPIAFSLNAITAIVEKGLNPEQIIITYPDMTRMLKRLFKEEEKQKQKQKPIEVPTS